MKARLRRLALPAAIFGACAAVYVAFLGNRLTRPTADNHYVHLANSWLHGQLDVVDGDPPGQNDWACYDTVSHGTCPPNRWSFPGQHDRYKWYVSFPPLPAVVVLPLVALGGTAVPDALFWAILAGLGPALLFVLLRSLRESGRSGRSVRDDLFLTGLFAFGTVYFFTAVQGSVWFAAHVVAVPLVAVFVLGSLGARRPLLAGLALGAAFLARPTTLYLAPLFVLEALDASRYLDAAVASPEAHALSRLWTWARAITVGPTLRRVVPFGAILLCFGAATAWYNSARFENPFEFGHSYLQIFWHDRIERWGLFNYHYLGRNLAIFVASLPWLSATEPYFVVSRHGLALWVTTPNLMTALWPTRASTLMTGLFLATGIVAVYNLCYQNSGWIQFGQRFALDYMTLLFALIALGGRRFRAGFLVAAILAVAINTFGAITFDRVGKYYDDDGSQTRIFQPD